MNIKDKIKNFECSYEKRKMHDGEMYYRSRNKAIMDRKMLIYTEDDNGCPVTILDPYKANNKLASGFMKLLVDQKVNYSLGKDINLKTEQSDELWNILGMRFQSTLKQIAKESSKKAIGWGHVYIDENGMFKLIKIPSEQIIPVYSSMDDETLEIVMRYYSVVVIDEKGKTDTVNRVEVWDREKVTYYQEDKKACNYRMLSEHEMYGVFGRHYPNPRLHLAKNMMYGDRTERTEFLAWGEIPFIPLYNNDEEMTDLEPVKNYIDVYDIVDSDFANNLEDFQDIYWILKGYNGENVGQFLDQVKRYRAIKVSEDGDARSEQQQVPYEARMVELENLESSIFKFGMGVNLNKTGDGNITNVVIKSRFANLDLKANQFEQEVEDFIFKLMYFVNRYAELTGRQPIELESITFNRSMMINEIELLDANTKQKGLVSEATRLSNHVWVDDVEGEIRLLEEERNNMISLLEEGEDNELGEEGEAIS